MGSIELGPVRQPLEYPAGRLHNVERATLQEERLPPQVGKRRLCVPTLHLDGEGIAEGALGSVHHSSGSPEMGKPDLVPNPQGNVMGQPDGVPILQAAATGSRGQPASAGVYPTFDGMARLRERLQEEGLSVEATELSLKAWAPDTIKKYQSCWKKWGNDCITLGREPSPIRTDISHVADFLGTQFKQGISYSQIGAYRSIQLASSGELCIEPTRQGRGTTGPGI